MRREIIAASLAVTLVACDALKLVPITSSLPVLAAFERHGIVVRRATPPSDVVAPAAVMAEAVRMAGIQAAQPDYLEPTCVPESVTPPPGVPLPDRCGMWDISLAAGETMGVWLITFPGVSMGASEGAWALFDARTGQFHLGDWP